MKRKGYIIAALAAFSVCAVCLYIWRFGSGSEPSTADYAPEEPCYTPVQQNETKLEEPSQTPFAYVSPVDFTALADINPDIYAWLQLSGTEISYPVLQRQGDDSYYLQRESSGMDSKTGCLFTQSSYNGVDFEDPVTVIYGHNAKSGSMFGSLQRYYTDAQWTKDTPFLYVYLPDKTLVYRFFAAVPYSRLHILYYYDFSSARMYNAFFDSVYRVHSLNAVLLEDLRPTPDERVLILSTCLKGERDKRFLVMGKLEEELSGAK